MPVFVTLGANGACLAFYDNPWDGGITLGERAEIRFTGGPARWYLAAGSLARVLELYTALTGRSPLPPRWALGYQQSQWGYRRQSEMRRIAEEFRRRELPLSALYLDIDCLRGNRVLTPDLRRYPTLPAWSRELRARGVHLVASVNPGIKGERRFDLYAEARRLGLFCRRPDGRPMPGVCWPGWAAWIDFTDPRAREWWGRQYGRLRELGIDGFWHDMNEPAVFTAGGDPSLPLCTRHELEGRGGDHREAHNLYGLGMNRAAYEGLRAREPERRPFIVSRSGWAGGQRYAWTWTGDMRTGWDNLRQSLASVLGLGLSGFPFAGPDIGGFSGEPPSAELFIRWFQLASFLPFFRTHSAWYLPRREPWEFGPEAEAILRKALELRYRLLPYWYTLAWEAGRTGAPPVRPLCWSDPGSAELRAADDAFLLGDALLVAPVFEPGASPAPGHAAARRVAGAGGRRPARGPGRVELAAPLDRIPRAGAGRERASRRTRPRARAHAGPHRVPAGRGRGRRRDAVQRRRGRLRPPPRGPLRAGALPRRLRSGLVERGRLPLALRRGAAGPEGLLSLRGCSSAARRFPRTGTAGRSPRGRRSRSSKPLDNHPAPVYCGQIGYYLSILTESRGVRACSFPSASSTPSTA